MPRVSELFYTRRYRCGRSSNPLDIGPEIDSPTIVDRNSCPHRSRRASNHHHDSGSRHRLDSEGCNPLRRPPRQSRQLVSNRPSHPPQERESIVVDRGIHNFASGNISIGNNQLPGSVLLARERLLLRLRGLTLSPNRLVGAGDSATPSSAHSVTQQKGKRPPGLTQEALNCLHVDIFSNSDEGNKQGVSTALGECHECSICLERFSEGDELISLPCHHRFHFSCLEPWLRTCGDCPYCRRDIVVTSDEVKARKF